MKTPNIVIIVLFTALLGPAALGQTTLERAIQMFDDGNWDEATPLFEQLSKQSPQSAAASYYLGMMCLNPASYEDAIEYLEKAAELDPANARYQLMLGDAYGLKAQNAGILKKFGAASDCKKHYERAVELDPSLVDARANLLEYYLQAPGIMGGSVDKARAQADAILKLDACLGHIEIARIHKYQKEPNEEEESYRRAVAADPARLLGYQSLWTFYMEGKNEAAAQAVFAEALRTLKDGTEMHYMAGLYYVQANDLRRAREAFADMLKADSTRITACYQLGKVALLSGEGLEGGLGYFERYLKVKPKKGDPGWAQTHWRMGMIREKLGQKDMARAEYQKALELNPKLAEAQKALKDLH